jgi:hypothetical protein
MTSLSDSAGFPRASIELYEWSVQFGVQWRAMTCNFQVIPGHSRLLEMLRPFGKADKDRILIENQYLRDRVAELERCVRQFETFIDLAS